MEHIHNLINGYLNNVNRAGGFQSASEGMEMMRDRMNAAQNEFVFAKLSHTKMLVSYQISHPNRRQPITIPVVSYRGYYSNGRMTSVRQDHISTKSDYRQEAQEKYDEMTQLYQTNLRIAKVLQKIEDSLSLDEIELLNSRAFRRSEFRHGLPSNRHATLRSFLDDSYQFIYEDF